MSSISQPEFRVDILTGREVLIAPARSARPASIRPDPTLCDDFDPFLSGREHETPKEWFCFPAERVADPSVKWSLRVVPNRYPAVISGTESLPLQDRATQSTNGHFFPTVPGNGHHDVVIECPDSRTRLVELSSGEIADIFRAWKIRMSGFRQAPRITMVSIFRNEGFSAGASLAHCHSQIIGTEKMTPLDILREQRARQWTDETGNEIVHALLHAELDSRERVVCVSKHFAVLCPFASVCSWHVRFVPRWEMPFTFDTTPDDCLVELADLLLKVLVRIESAIGARFSFNLILPHPRIDRSPDFRWMLELLPRTSRPAGWESLTSVEIVTVSPETAARSLRAMLS